MTGGRPAAAGAGLLAVLAALPAGPASATWPPSTARTTSGALSVATLAQGFTMVSGTGTGGATYTASKLLGATVGYVDLVNRGSVPVYLSGTADLSSFASTTVRIDRCSAVWTGSSCPGTQATLMSSTLSSRTNVDWQSTPVAAGQVVHLQVTLGGSVTNSITLTAASRAARSPGDRTRG